jgi:hypothetical protein
METAAILSQNILWLLLSVLIIIYASKDKRIDVFVKAIIIATFSIRILLSIGTDILTNTFKVWKWYSSNISFLVQFLYAFSYFLMFYGLSLLIGFTNKKVEVELKPYKGKYRSIWLSFLLFVITGGIYLPFWLYRTVKDLKENYDDIIPYTAGQAVGYLFIPIFNIYWLFKIIITLPLKIKQIEDNYFGNNPKFQFHPILIILLWFSFIIISNLSQLSIEYDDFKELLTAILFPTFSIFIILLTMQAKINSFLYLKGENNS